MNFFTKKTPFYRKKKLMIPLIIILFFVVLRVIAPPIILNQINAQLKEFSPSISGHVEDLDLRVLAGGAVLEGITVKTKKDNKQFLKVESVDGSIALRELFKGNVVTEAVVNKADFTYTNGLMPAVKEHVAANKDKEDKPLPDIRVARVDLKDSVMRVEAYPALTKEQGVLMSEINARATNLIPSKDLPKTIFSMQGKLLESGTVKVNGEALTEDKPLKWAVDSEILSFDLTSLNRFLKQKVPMTFSKGELDFFMEAKSEEGKVAGYVKPFIKDLDVIKSKEEFKNTKHWIFEVITALGNITVRADEEAATRVPFTFDGTLKAETGEALSKAFQHGYVQELSRGIENSIQL
ncbi:MAG: DUF748 domain-containing protein [Bdellovibrionales bacterium]|nr:DUF748 domain-containing protein [Bdellovibrionales bacterium]